MKLNTFLLAALVSTAAPVFAQGMGSGNYPPGMGPQMMGAQPAQNSAETLKAM